MGLTDQVRDPVASLSSWRPGFAPGSFHIGFVVRRVALGHVSDPVLLNIIPSSLSNSCHLGDEQYVP
jgi:hypothetical protein